MIYYPLSTLRLAGIKDILVISTPEDTPRFQALLGDGHYFGIKLQYAVQTSPDGLAQAFIIGEKFIYGQPCAMILGDDIFYGNGLEYKLKKAVADAIDGRATVFGYYIEDSERFGVVEFDKDGRAVSIEEKPAQPKSNYAVTGLYFYPAGVANKAKEFRPSIRGELEITTLNAMYLEEDKLNVALLGRGFTWFDTGTMNSLLDAACFIRMMQGYQGMIVSSPEEIAYRYKWITKEELVACIGKYGKSTYGRRLLDVAEGKVLR